MIVLTQNNENEKELDRFSSPSSIHFKFDAFGGGGGQEDTIGIIIFKSISKINQSISQEILHNKRLSERSRQVSTKREKRGVERYKR